ncbi:MAG: anti-sigma factor antagonist [Planctomycetes bacterium]|nr:anti-sigma factor antagonist [Planctomycetota bacterium]
MPSQPDLLFGKLAVMNRMVVQEKVDECIRIQEVNRQMGLELSLGEILIRKNYLTKEQVDTVARAQQYLEARKEDMRFGELAMRNGFVTKERIGEALAIQEATFKQNKPFPRIGQVLLDKNYITRQQISAILSAQLRLKSAEGTMGGEGAVEGAPAMGPSDGASPIEAPRESALVKESERAAAAWRPKAKTAAVPAADLMKVEVERTMKAEGLTVNLRTVKLEASERNPEKVIQVLDVIGSLDGRTFPYFEEFCTKLMTAGFYNLVINCDSLTYISSAGMGVFLGLAQRSRDNRGDMCLTTMPERIKQIVNLLGLPKMIRIYDIERGALGSFKFY